MANDFYKIKSGLNIPTYPDLISANAIPNLKQGDAVVVDGTIFIYNGTEWIGASVLSVNEKTGDVALTTADIPEDPLPGATRVYYSDDKAKAAAVVNSTAGTQTDKAASVQAMKNYSVAKTGSAVTGNITFADGTGIESTADNSELNIGTTPYSHKVNIGTGDHASEINIGTGTGVSTINIGHTGDTVNINGSVNYIGVTNLNVSDKDINLNVGGVAGSGNSAGIHVEEGGSITGFVHVGNARNSWEIKAPNKPGTVQITPPNNSSNVEIVSQATSNRSVSIPDTDGTVVISSDGNKITASQLPTNFSTADVPEDPTPGTTRLYFADSRAKTAAVVNSTAGTQTDQAASVQAMKNYAVAAIEKGAVSGVATLNSSSQLVSTQFPDSITKTLVVEAFGGAGGSIRLKENGGSNYVSFKSPDSLITDTTWTLPPNDGTTGQVLATLGDGSLEWRTSGTIASTDTVAAAGYALNPSSVNTITTSYLLSSLDNGRVIVANSSSSLSITIPVGLPVGFNCVVIQVGSGQVTMTASGTTLNSVNGFKISAQHGSLSVMSYAANVFNISGNTTF
jgi:hypothetical protein